MNILHICSYYGGSKLYTELNHAFQRAELSSTFYVPTQASQESRLAEENVKESVCFTGFDRYFFHWKHYKILKDLYAHLPVTEYSLVHAHSLFSNGYIAYRLKKAHNLPYITAVRNTDVNTFFKKMPHLRGLGVDILRNASAVVFLSAAYRDALLAQYIPAADRETIAKKSYIIPNGINSYWLEHKVLDKTPPPGKAIRIVFAGSIEPLKNPTATAEACRLLIDKGYTVTYTMVGNIRKPALQDELIKMPFIRYLPAMDKEGLAALYKEQDLFVMPSVAETFGLVYAEAMTQGLPVIYTREQGFDRQFEEGVVGYHVDCHNPQDIADRILDCLKNYAEISHNCAALSDKFNWDTIAEEYARLYETVMP